MKCSICGAINADGGLYCAKCGAVSAPAPSPVPAAGKAYSPQPAPDFRTQPDVRLRETDAAPKPDAVRPRPLKKKISPAKALAASLAILVLIAAGAAGGRAFSRSRQYRLAVQAYENRDLLEARDAFRELGGYRDSAFRLRECDSMIDRVIGSYNEALACYAAGDYEQAYYIFTALNGFEDSETRAEACIQPYPADGLVETGENFTEGPTQLRVSNRSIYPAFLEIYLEHRVLWCTLWLSPFSEQVLPLAPGRYQIIWSTGTLWFGTYDRFGSDEQVDVCTSGEDNYYFEVTQETPSLDLTAPASINRYGDAT